MNEQCNKFVSYIINDAPKHNKTAVETAASMTFALVKDRKVYHNDAFAVRFCYTSRKSFSNTVLSLSALEKYDRIPVFVVIVKRDADNEILLANTSFLKKISHSSFGLTLTNIRGSFNGSDIIRIFNDMSNSPENFDAMFEIHRSIDWDENLARLVEATSTTKPTLKRYNPDANAVSRIYSSVSKAREFVASKDYNALLKELDDRCKRFANEIMIASHIENINIRGRLIEQLIAADDSERQEIIADIHKCEQQLPTYKSTNSLGDFRRTYSGTKTFTDIKTKIVYLHSNPKAYNIDKFLEQMADGNSVLLFYFIGIDARRITRTILCSVYHRALLEDGNTIIQRHWAGLSRRGTAQFKGEIINGMLSSETFVNDIDEDTAKGFLAELI